MHTISQEAKQALENIFQMNSSMHRLAICTTNIKAYYARDAGKRFCIHGLTHNGSKITISQFKVISTFTFFPLKHIEYGSVVEKKRALPLV